MICSDMLQCRKVLFLLVHFLVLVQWIFHNFRGPGNKPTNNNHVLGTLGKFQFFIVRELFTTKKSGKFLQLSGKFLQLSGKFLQLSGNSLQPPFCLIVREKGIGQSESYSMTHTIRHTRNLWRNSEGVIDIFFSHHLCNF